jgi:hypothetical protein
MARFKPSSIAVVLLWILFAAPSVGINNVLLGAAIGGAAGGVVAAVGHPGSDGTNSGTTSMGVLAGAGVGAGVVALKHLFTKRYVTVFTR